MPPKNPMNTPGVLVTGTHAKCGKTVACAGIAGVLNDLGFHAQAMKPLSFQPKISMRSGYEQAYFDRLVPPMQMVDTFSAETAHTLTPLYYQRLLETCRKRAFPYLLETPGSLASPIRYNNQLQAEDAIDLARELDTRILLVTSKQPDIIGCLAPVFAYLWHRDASVIGWLAVETEPMEAHNYAPNWDTDVFYLRGQYDIPYLGEIGYSPSISVENLQQGNLYRTTELGIDLLPIQQALDLLIPL